MYIEFITKKLDKTWPDLLILNLSHITATLYMYKLNQIKTIESTEYQLLDKVLVFNIGKISAISKQYWSW